MKRGYMTEREIDTVLKMTSGKFPDKEDSVAFLEAVAGFLGAIDNTGMITIVKV